MPGPLVPLALRLGGRALVGVARAALPSLVGIGGWAVRHPAWAYVILDLGWDISEEAARVLVEMARQAAQSERSWEQGAAVNAAGAPAFLPY